MTRRLRGVAATFGATTAALVLLGAPLGLLWAAVAPHATYLLTGQGPLPADPESDAVFAADGWFTLIALGAGLVCGVLACLLPRWRGPASVLGLAVGGLLGAVVAWRVGRLVDLGQYRHMLDGGVRGARVPGPLTLRARGVLVVWPLLSVVTVAVVEVVGMLRENRRALPR